MSLLQLFLALALLLSSPSSSSSDPQTTLLADDCNQLNATNPYVALILNSTFSSLRSAFIALNSNTSSATTATFTHDFGSTVLYSLFLCRPYLSLSDCLLCLSAASTALNSTCPSAFGADVTLDGCFLRYEIFSFYQESTNYNNRRAACGPHQNKTTANAADVNALLLGLSKAAPGTGSYFAAGQIGGVYGVAQCVGTVNETGCADCLGSAYGNAKQCLPNAQGSGVDAGCFMRYSDVGFFGSYGTVDIQTYLVDSGEISGYCTLLSRQ